MKMVWMDRIDQIRRIYNLGVKPVTAYPDTQPAIKKVGHPVHHQKIFTYDGESEGDGCGEVERSHAEIEELSQQRVQVQQHLQQVGHAGEAQERDKPT